MLEDVEDVEAVENYTTALLEKLPNSLEEINRYRPSSAVALNPDDPLYPFTEFTDALTHGFTNSASPERLLINIASYNVDCATYKQLALSIYLAHYTYQQATSSQTNIPENIFHSLVIISLRILLKLHGFDGPQKNGIFIKDLHLGEENFKRLKTKARELKEKTSNLKRLITKLELFILSINNFSILLTPRELEGVTRFWGSIPPCNTSLSRYSFWDYKEDTAQTEQKAPQFACTALSSKN